MCLLSKDDCDHRQFFEALLFLQMSPEVYSPQAGQLGLETSLAERLFDLYVQDEESAKQSNVLFLTENYRSNQEILKFPSFHFYGDELVASGHNFSPSASKVRPFAVLFSSWKGRRRSKIIHMSTCPRLMK